MNDNKLYEVPPFPDFDLENEDIPVIEPSQMGLLFGIFKFFMIGVSIFLILLGIKLLTEL